MWKKLVITIISLVLFCCLLVFCYDDYTFIPKLDVNNPIKLSIKEAKILINEYIINEYNPEIKNKWEIEDLEDISPENCWKKMRIQIFSSFFNDFIIKNGNVVFDVNGMIVSSRIVDFNSNGIPELFYTAFTSQFLYAPAISSLQPNRYFFGVYTEDTAKIFNVFPKVMKDSFWLRKINDLTLMLSNDKSKSLCYLKSINNKPQIVIERIEEPKKLQPQPQTLPGHKIAKLSLEVATFLINRYHNDRQDLLSTDIKEITPDDVWKRMEIQFFCSFNRTYMIKKGKIIAQEISFHSPCVVDMNSNGIPEMLYFANLNNNYSYLKIITEDTNLVHDCLPKKVRKPSVIGSIHGKQPIEIEKINDKSVIVNAGIWDYFVYSEKIDYKWQVVIETKRK